jgi:hypothetical protein
MEREQVVVVVAIETDVAVAELPRRRTNLVRTSLGLSTPEFSF